MSQQENLKSLIVGFNLTKAMSGLLKQKPVTVSKILSLLKSYSSCVTISRPVLISLPNEMTENFTLGLEETIEFDKLVAMATEGLSEDADEDEIIPSDLVKQFDDYTSNLSKTLAVAIAALARADGLLAENLLPHEEKIVNECNEIDNKCADEMGKIRNIRRAEIEGEDSGNMNAVKEAQLEMTKEEDDDIELIVGGDTTGLKKISEDFNVRD